VSAGFSERKDTMKHLFLAAAAVIAMIAMPAGATTTPIGPPASGEMSVANILSSLYLSTTRIDDDLDQIWQDLDGGVTVEAKYAGFWNGLGYSLNELTGASYTSLLSVAHVGDTASFDIVPNSDVFVWGIDVNGTGSHFYSNPALNGGVDRMVTFRVDQFLNGSYPTVPTYVICFEDLTDFDFNDLVVEVRNVAPVPEPLSMFCVALGVGGLARYLRKRVQD